MSSEKSPTPVTIALLGNPNTGKSTLFTALVGGHQRVGNYPGVTVEKKSGSFFYAGRRFEVVDLPGLYSLSPQSRDEVVAVEVLLGRSPGTPAPDGVILIVDATNLERNLYLVSQVLEFGLPTVVALNKIDLAQRQGIQMDLPALERRLGVRVVPTQAHRREGIKELQAALAQAIAQGPRSFPSPLPEAFVEQVRQLGEEWKGLGFPSPFIARLLLDATGYLQKTFLAGPKTEQAERLERAKTRLAELGILVPDIEATARYQWIEQILQGIVSRPEKEPVSITDRLDWFLTHRVWGLAVFVVVMAVVFQAVFAWAEPLMAWIDAAVVWATERVQAGLPPGPLRSLLVEGVLAGLGSVFIFLPQILILFLFIGILEDCGYMARAAYLMDRWMVRVGLSGKAFIPLLSSFACAVPGIMATRVIEEERARMTTILVAPLMTCSARLPVYAMLIGAFVPQRSYLGGLVHLHGLVLGAMYLLGILAAVGVAWVLKRLLFTGPLPPFVMELPNYQWPSLRTVFYRVVERGWVFLRFAGTIILAVSVVVWAALYYPHPSEEVERPFITQVQELGYRLQRWFQQQEVRNYPINLGALASQLSSAEPPLEALLQQTADQIRFFLEHSSDRPEESGSSCSGPSARALTPSEPQLVVQKEGKRLLREVEQLQAAITGAYQRQSLLGRLGRVLEPIFLPLGWDWRIGMAVIASFSAREVVVATLGVIFNGGPMDSDNSEAMTQLHDRLSAATWEDTDEKLFNLPVALGMMVFYTLSAQCVATLIAIWQETRKWQWSLFVFVYMTTLAYLGNLLTYQLARLFS